MNCHRGAIAVTTPSTAKRVILLGMPNAGKSTFFNRITGAAAFVGNWPGVTVDLLQAPVRLNDEVVEFVDLPGIYDLNSFSNDERVVQQFLETFPVNLVVLILNAAQIDRQLRLALQVKALGLPAVLLLNMADEARRYGIQIATDTLARSLEMPVCLISAKQGQGFMAAYQTIARSLASRTAAYRVPSMQASLAAVGPPAAVEINAVLSQAVKMPSQLTMRLTARLDRVLLHPILGLPLFFVTMFLAFWMIWAVGLPSQSLMGDLTQALQTRLLEPLLSPLPAWFQSLAIDGVWNGLSTVASFLPLILLFFVLIAILEDSGYLSRSAYLMDALMSRLGLDGRSFVLQMMGFGCNVPALMGARILRSQSLRLLTMLIIPFSVCSARLQVFIFIIAAVFPSAYGAAALFSLYLLSFGVALGTAALLQGAFPHDEPFVLELPPYRFPTWRQVLLRSWGEVKHFLNRATGFIILGCVAIWVLTYLPPGATGLDTLGGQIGQHLQPIMAPLGINPYLTLALIFGFIAKEVVIGALAVIYGLNAALVSSHLSETLTLAQGYSFCIFCLLYTPCLTTLVTLWSESKSWRFTLFSLSLSLGLAWIASFIFYQGVSLLVRI
jgi:ferrous iron transport protein B